MAELEFLGRLSDIFGPTKSLDLPNDVETIADLKIWLNSSYDTKALAGEAIRAIINNALVQDNNCIDNDDKIAFFPPVGGG